MLQDPFNEDAAQEADSRYAYRVGGQIFAALVILFCALAIAASVAFAVGKIVSWVFG